jgi:hypothetical protein
VGDASVHGVARAPEVVKLDLEPVINLFVDFEVPVTYLLWSCLLLTSFHLGGCAELVSAAHEDGIVASKSAVTSVAVS